MVRWCSVAKRWHGVAWWKGHTESQKMASCVSRALGGLSAHMAQQLNAYFVVNTIVTARGIVFKFVTKPKKTLPH